MRIAYVVGARPNFVKMAPVIAELRRRMPDGRHALIHTGQHYDRLMSEIFLEELGVPAPDHMLGVGSASHAVQTARVMERIEPVLEEEHPDLVIVPGDVNSTLAATLVAVKLGIPVAHVESGLRSFDRTMPEEINRIVADEFACALQGASPLCITRPRVEKGGRFGAHPRDPRRERCPWGRGVRAPPPSHMQAPGPVNAPARLDATGSRSDAGPRRRSVARLAYNRATLSTRAPRVIPRRPAISPARAFKDRGAGAALTGRSVAR
jgi:hypothetical protein